MKKKKYLADLIRRYMVAHKLSYRELAKRMNMNGSHVYRVASGQYVPKTLQGAMIFADKLHGISKKDVMSAFLKDNQ